MDNFIHPNCYNFRIIAVKVPSIRKVLFFLNKNFLKRKVLKKIVVAADDVSLRALKTGSRCFLCLPKEIKNEQLS